MHDRMAKRTRGTACVSVALAMAVARVQAQGPVADSVSLEQRVTIASRLYAAIPLYFAHWQGVPVGFNLDSAYRQYVRRVISSADRREFDFASMEFVAQLRNGHTSFRDSWLRDRFGQPFGFEVMPIGRDWVVIASRREGLTVGDEIRAIDDEEVERFFGRQRRFLAASDERWARFSLFRSPHLFNPRFTVTVRDGRSIVIDRTGDPLPSQRPYYETRLLDGGQVGYLKIRSFLPERQLEDSALAFVRAHRRAAGLIIDVRGNEGGATPMRLIGALMDRPYRWFIEATPGQPALDRDRRPQAMLRWDSPTTSPDSAAFAGKVVILTDGACWSACDGFVVSFKDNHRATIVGDTTGGSSGQPVFLSLGNGMSFQVSMKREFLPDGSPFEGVGIAPDIVLRPTPEEIRRGEDRVLAKALSIIKAP